MEGLILKPDEKVDTLLNGRLIIQDPKRFMFGLDAVLLSSFASSMVRAKDTVIDLGTGTGIIPLLMETSTNASHFTALEVQKDSANMALRTMEANNITDKIEVIEGDVKNVSSLFKKHSFSVVTTNPPYMINQHGKQNNKDAKTIARHEILCTLEDIISAADYLLEPKGKFFMIHRPFRLPEIFTIMKNHGIEPKRMQLVEPFEGKEANIVLIEGRKNANPRLKIENVLRVYNKPESNKQNSYTKEILDIYERQKINT